jgi:hypothetical protein
LSLSFQNTIILKFASPTGKLKLVDVDSHLLYHNYKLSSITSFVSSEKKIKKKNPNLIYATAAAQFFS